MTTATGAKTFAIDPVHSSVEFSIRHMMLSKVRGRFNTVSGTIEFPAIGVVPTSVSAVIDAASIDTRDPQRDGHLKSPDFLDVATYPNITFTSTGTSNVNGSNFDLNGNLSIHGVTKSITLKAEHAGRTTDPWGNDRIAFAATTKISRKDFGLTWNQTLETGGLVVGEDLDITLEIQGTAAK
jgi:polyisoprenoid-binding protein YceI